MLPLLIGLFILLIVAVVCRRLAYRELCRFPWERALLRDPDELDEDDLPDEIPDEIYTPLIFFAGLTKLTLPIGFSLIAMSSSHPGTLAVPSLLVTAVYAVASLAADWDRAIGWERHAVPVEQTRRWFSYRAAGSMAFALWLGSCLFLMFSLVP
jgi:hypothetical protein